MLQMGAPVGQGNERKEGWAWVDTQPGQDAEILEAYRLADLVSNTLRLEVRPDLGSQERHIPLLKQGLQGSVFGCCEKERASHRRVSVSAG